MNLSEAVNRVIDLAGKVRDYYNTELPKRHRHYPLVEPNEETAPPPPEEKELSDLLAALSDDLIYRLVLIVDLARGSCTPDNLAECYAALPDTVGTPEDARAYLMVFQASLADELSDGLEELRNHKINVDRLPLKKVKVQKR